MTTRTESDLLPRPLIEQLSIRGLMVADPDDPGVSRPSGPFTVTLVRQQGEVAAAVLGLLDDDESSGLLEEAAVAGIAGSATDLPTAVGSLEELAAQLSIPLDVVVVLRDGRPVGFLAVVVDRRSRPSAPHEDTFLGEGAIPTTDPMGTGSIGAGAMGAGVTGAGVAGGSVIGNADLPAGLAVDGPLGLLRNVALEVTVELGRASLTLAQLLGLTIGSVVELDRVAGSPVDIRVNGMLFGRGEVVVVGEEYAVRIIEILSTGLAG